MSSRKAAKSFERAILASPDLRLESEKQNGFTGRRKFSAKLYGDFLYEKSHFGFAVYCKLDRVDPKGAVLDRLRWKFPEKPGLKKP